MLSYHVVNLIISGEPDKIELAVPPGMWTLEKQPEYRAAAQAMQAGQCAETYFLEHPARPEDGARAVDAAFGNLTPVLLGASYATGSSVTIRRSTSGSDLSIMQPSEYWPRDRAMSPSYPVVKDGDQFRELVEGFARAWPTTGQSEKARLLVHHWLDGLACWSMEDLYLSATTLLQIIVATEAGLQGKRELHYYPGITDAANRKRIRQLSHDFKNMRNELIHDGRLIGRRFRGPDKAACADVVADVLNWFDEYVHAALGLGTPQMTRYRGQDFLGLNAYSLG